MDMDKAARALKGIQDEPTDEEKKSKENAIKKILAKGTSYSLVQLVCPASVIMTPTAIRFVIQPTALHRSNTSTPRRYHRPLSSGSVKRSPSDCRDSSGASGSMIPSLSTWLRWRDARMRSRRSMCEFSVVCFVTGDWSKRC